MGGSTEAGTTAKGKIYCGWMDVKNTAVGRDKESVIASNIYGEEWAQ
ncbi:hypothetical protein [uncultured Pontibacter sp.]|nr:hypothetical protein [uncultured Pontibacter sp.]